jgi:hypothetical protein
MVYFLLAQKVPKKQDFGKFHGIGTLRQAEDLIPISFRNDVGINATREAKIFYTLAYAFDAATATHEIFQGR